MRRFSVAALAFATCYSSASAKGVCSTGAYKTCVSCCKTHPAVTNRELCTCQCGDYGFWNARTKRVGTNKHRA